MRMYNPAEIEGYQVSHSIFEINPFLINVSLKNKPGSWLLLAKCLENNCARVTWIFTENVTLPQVFFKHFANKENYLVYP